MRIGIKISPLTVLRTGIPNYILNLLRSIAEKDSSNEYFLYTNRPIPFDLGLPERFKTVVVRFPSPRLQLWYQVGLPIRMRRDRLDLFHDPVYPLPIGLPVPGVITIHDLSAYTDPGVHSLRASLAGKFYPRFLEKARRIITISRFTGTEIARLFPEAADKVRVVYCGVNPGFRKVENGELLAGVKKKHGLPDRFFLFLGTMEPRKNLERLLDAFESVGDRIRHYMVITGGRGWSYGGILSKIENHPFRERIVLTGFVSNDELPALVSMADFLVYPSILEGFGLPIIESMACGTPVITSSVSAMPEVAGDAAVLVDPFSVSSIAGGLIEMAENESLRNELSAKGLERASLFTWNKAAEETLEVYREAAEEAGV